MPILGFFLSFKGRVGRLAFALGSTVAGVISSLALLVLGGNPFGSQPTLLLGAAALALTLPMWALTVKRCHDLGLPGWWSVPTLASLPLAAHATELLTAATWNPGLVAEASIIAGVASMICLISIGLMFKLCFFVGQSGNNAFGPERSLAQTFFDYSTAAEAGENGPNWADKALAAATAEPPPERSAVRLAGATHAVATARGSAAPAFGRRR